MQQLRGQVAELQGQVDQQQPVTMDLVHNLVKDELQEVLHLQKKLPKPRQPRSRQAIVTEQMQAQQAVATTVAEQVQAQLKQRNQQQLKPWLEQRNQQQLKLRSQQQLRSWSRAASSS